MATPDLSITIPTYNRAPYLQYLLESLARQIGDLTHSYEIVISDNASADNTEAVVQSFTGKLNIVYIKRDKNYGPEDNREELIRRARGTVQIYVGDDDDLILSEVDKIVTRMLADPAIGVVFVPWKIYNRAEGKMVAEAFYHLDNDVEIAQNDFEALLTLILQNHIFPEISIIRSDLLRIAFTKPHPQAFWAFVHAAEYLTHSKILFHKNPFYLTITLHSKDDKRQQLGHLEVLTSWDRYRGGLEYILARVPQSRLTSESFQNYLVLIQKFIAMRLSVAIRLRIGSKQDPLDTYYLACRLRAMGYEPLLPVSFKEIRIQAAVHYFLHMPTASDAIDKLVCAGNIPDSFMNVLRTRANRPPVIAEKFLPEQYPHALTLVAGSLRELKLDPKVLAEHKVRAVGLTDLMQKFA